MATYCRNCGNQFQPTPERLEYCRTCFTKLMKKMVNTPLQQVVKGAGSKLVDDMNRTHRNNGDSSS